MDAGEYAPMDISRRTNGMSAIVRNFPIGVISMVSPFNFPLNLTAHKVAPALAVGYAHTQISGGIAPSLLT
jgi:acyl-CoA reductase-like NAD-dependent aldehyde dehydrogenase